MNRLFVVVVVLLGWSEAAKWPVKNGQPCACNRLHHPVCGNDNVDYPNPACAVNCGKVSGYRIGTCDRPSLCGCPYTIQTVCARRPDGTLDNFDNSCVAECETGAKVVSEGACAARPVQPLPGSGRLEKRANDQCICTMEYNPVCGLKNGQWTTYGNLCSATCAMVETTKRGACGRRQSVCACGRNYAPVCARATDGTLKSYSNQCGADCEDAVKVYDGRCSESPDNSLPGGLDMAKRGDCICTKIYKPVCALKSGTWATYSNLCMAKCDGKPDEIQDGNCLQASQHPVFPGKRRDYSEPVAAQLPVFPHDSNLVANQLPVFPHDSNLVANQLPVFPHDKDDSSDDSSDEDLVASQLPVFPRIFQNLFQ